MKDFSLETLVISTEKTTRSINNHPRKLSGYVSLYSGETALFFS